MKSFVTAAILGASLVAATPVQWTEYGSQRRGDSVKAAESASQGWSGWPASSSAPSASTPPAAPSGTVQNGAFSFPLSNGFPNLAAGSAALLATEQQAHGTLPNGPPPATVANDDLTSLKLIAFNEIHEVAFFTELLNNITTGVPGYGFQDQNFKAEVITAITAIQAQEELHAVNANNALTHFASQSGGPIAPCKYSYPVSTYADAIALASTFTDVVLGTLGDIQTLFGANGDSGLIRGVAGVIGQEGEQNGWFRSQEGKIPSQLPFLTAGARAFAFNAINQDFVVPGSCPYDPAATIGLPLFSGTLDLTTTGALTLADQTLQFSIAFTGKNDGTAVGSSPLSLVYINQQNLPITMPIASVANANGAATFSASFPGATDFLNGLTIAVVVNGQKNFTSVDDVAAATVFGPAFIEIN